MFRTLLVDDDFLVRSYLKTLNAWEKAGYEVVKGCTGRRGGPARSGGRED